MGTLVGGIVALLLGWILYGMLLMDFMSQHSTIEMYEQPQWLYMVIGHLFFGAFLTYVFMKWANVSNFGGGLQAGFILVLLFSLGWNIIWVGISPQVDITYAIVDSLVSAVIAGIAGGCIGLVLGMGGSSQPAPAMH